MRWCERYDTARQATSDNTMQHRKDLICMPDNEGKNKNTHTRNN